MRKQNLFKKAAVFVLAGVMMTGGTMPTFAYWPGMWRDDEYGRTWITAGYQMDWINGTNNDSFIFNHLGGKWVWIDDNADGIAECYYFGVDRDGNSLPPPQYTQDEHGNWWSPTEENGYLVRDTITPDGYTVNPDGEWVVDGVVQTKNSSQIEYGLIRNGVDVISTAGAVTDGKSWPQITFDETLLIASETVNGLDLLPQNRTQIAPGDFGEDAFGPVYSMQYKGKTVTFATSTQSNCAGGYRGPVSALFTNFPEQGMELNAFYDNTNYESLAWERQPYGTTGSSDQVFKLPQASYRMGAGTIILKERNKLAQGRTARNNVPEADYLSSTMNFQILLTAGEDGKWYIYPDSPVHTN